MRGIQMQRVISMVSPSGRLLASRHVTKSRVLCQPLRAMSSHGVGNEESYEAFNKKYVDFFNKGADDLFELSRGLNNCMSMDVIPAPEVLEAAMRCARNQNCIALALRVLAGLKGKVSASVYKEYIAELRPVMDELGVPEPSEVGIEW